MPFEAASAGIDLPQPRSTQKRIPIVPALDSFREFVQFFRVAAA
jgi:hypothetical protein